MLGLVVAIMNKREFARVVRLTFILKKRIPKFLFQYHWGIYLCIGCYGGSICIKVLYYILQMVKCKSHDTDSFLNKDPSGWFTFWGKDAHGFSMCDDFPTSCIIPDAIYVTFVGCSLIFSKKWARGK